MVPIAATALLFTRLDGATILDHDVRRRILDHVRQAPGIRPAQLARALGLHRKTVLYHLRHLERIGSVKVHRDGRALRCLPPGAAPPVAPPPARHAEALRALRALGATGPAGLARLLRIPRGTAGSLLERLVARGWVVRDGAAFRPREAYPGERPVGPT